MKQLHWPAIATAALPILVGLSSAPSQADSIVPAADGIGTQVTPNGTDYTITGGTPSADTQNLFHRFTEFNLLTGESATFVTDPTVLNILSGITGSNPSIIDGLLQVSGSQANLWLINPNGILFGPNAALNLQGSFTAVTADQVNFAEGAFGAIGSADYAALVGEPQSLSFSLANPASVVNLGNLNVSAGESVVLVGGQVLNTGTIAAPGGAVVISAVAGGSLVRIAQEGALLNLEVATLEDMPGEPTVFSPLSLPELLTGSAIAPADTVTVNPDGSVQLANGAMVSTETGATTVSGAIAVNGAQGGQILVLGQDITLTAATLEASGPGGGGWVRVGGDYQGQGSLPRAQTTQMDAASTILADALDQGDGGRVILWADGDTLFQGWISAQGGPNGGAGGFVETSGLQTIEVDGGMAIATAPAGPAGTWLLDPSNISIDRTLADTIQNTLAAGTNFVASTIEGEAATVNESGILPGEGDIILNANINATAIGNATLTLTASRYIRVGDLPDGAAPITISGGNLVLNLNQEGLAEPDNPTINDALRTIGTVTGDITVNLGAGTYQEGREIFLTPGITLQGVGAEATVLDGAGDHLVLFVTAASGNEASPTQVNDLTIANGSAAPEGGGGILNLGNLIINNSVIRDNESATIGGGILNERLETSTSPDEGALVINNSIIRNNSAGDGGGIYNDGGIVTISNSIFADNAATDSGGGINNFGTLTVADSTFSDNTAQSGGGLYNTDTATVTTSTFTGNAATDDGGGIANFGTLTVTNSTLSGNSADLSGGGIANDGDLTVRNSTLAFNDAAEGGGIANNFLEDTDDAVSGSLLLGSSLVTGNAAASGANLFDEGSYTSDGRNLFGSEGNAGMIGAALISSDIVPAVAVNQILSNVLQDNGGPTQTLALVAESPAIDAGGGTGPDQRGLPIRGSSRDIGAFEWQLPSASDSPPLGSPPTSPETGSPPIANPGTIAECLAGDCDPPPPPPRSPRRPREQQRAAAPRRLPELGFQQQFEEHLGVEAAAFEDLDALDRAQTITGVTPALVYASFVPPPPEPVAIAPDAAAIASATPKELTEDELAQQMVAQAEESPPSGAIADVTDVADEDVLQLVLVTGDNPPRRINTGATRSQVLAAVRQLQVELTDRTRRRLDNYLTPAQALYGWLMAPLEPALAAEEIRHVSFVLDEGLRSLPIAALHDGEQFIIENYSVGLMPSLSLTDTRIGNIRNAEVLAMGASEFSDQPPLPAVPLEIATINNLWAGTTHLNETFTPSTLVTERSENAYSILHLATHGQFTSGTLSNSYIQFWDRRVSLDELPQLQLSNPPVELLVLSACRTVLGDEEAELGFAGLAVKSGAKSAIAALWQVSDLETAGFMAELYTHLGQVTYKAEALRQAQLAMLRGAVTVQGGELVWSGGRESLPEAFQTLRLADTQHPYYWSAFTLVGNPW